VSQLRTSPLSLISSVQRANVLPQAYYEDEDEDEDDVDGDDDKEDEEDDEDDQDVEPVQLSRPEKLKQRTNINPLNLPKQRWGAGVKKQPDLPLAKKKKKEQVLDLALELLTELVQERRQKQRRTH